MKMWIGQSGLLYFSKLHTGVSPSSLDLFSGMSI